MPSPSASQARRHPASYPHQGHFPSATRARQSAPPALLATRIRIASQRQPQRSRASIHAHDHRLHSLRGIAWASETHDSPPSCAHRLPDSCHAPPWAQGRPYRQRNWFHSLPARRAYTRFQTAPLPAPLIPQALHAPLGRVVQAERWRANCPPVEDTCRMRPPPCLRRCGSAARITWIEPIRVHRHNGDQSPV